MTYKFTVEECAQPCNLRLTVYVQDDNEKWSVLDIIEGPYRFIINRLTGFYTDELRLRKV